MGEGQGEGDGMDRPGWRTERRGACCAAVGEVGSEAGMASKGGGRAAGIVLSDEAGYQVLRALEAESARKAVSGS